MFAVFVNVHKYHPSSNEVMLLFCIVPPDEPNVPLLKLYQLNPPPWFDITKKLAFPDFAIILIVCKEFIAEFCSIYEREAPVDCNFQALLVPAYPLCPPYN